MATETWNYRVLAFPNKFGSGKFMRVHSVYYTDGVPHSYSATPAVVGGETVREIKDDLLRFAEAMDKPVLWGAEQFPKECKK